MCLDWVAQECAERGEDYDIVKLRDVGADETDRIDRKRKKKNPDQGFAGVYVCVCRCVCGCVCVWNKTRTVLLLCMVSIFLRTFLAFH